MAGMADNHSLPFFPSRLGTGSPCLFVCVCAFVCVCVLPLPLNLLCYTCVPTHTHTHVYMKLLILYSGLNEHFDNIVIVP